MLGRERDPVALVEDALAVLWHQREHLATGASGLAPSPVARTELAARLLGDAHALDDDRRLAAVLLRAARLLDPAVQGAEGADPEDSPAGSEAAEPPGAPTSSTREEWESLGVLTDRVSSTCLALGLRATGGSAAAQRVRGHADAWAVQHLTWRDLDEGLRFAADQTVLVCENPRVVEAAAELGPAGVALVSTSGRPALVTLEVLARLRGAGARLHYHGDFDWAGVAMANDAVARFGAVPWRMAAADYLGLPGRLPLRGRRVEASWDPELAPAMAHRGLAVHEEAGLPELVQSFSELVATRRDNDSPLDEQRADGPLERAPRSRGSGRGVAERPCEDIP